MTRLGFFFFVCTLFAHPLSAEERVGGTLENVDILIEDLYNDDGHDHGEKYTAINRGKSGMRVSIRLTDAENVDDQLIDHTVIIDPNRKADLGSVFQKDILKAANWKYEWKVQQDTASQTDENADTQDTADQTDLNMDIQEDL